VTSSDASQARVTFPASPIRNYSLGTQEAIDAERVELHWPPDESHQDKLRLQV
jgi:hypothetical protein